MKMMRVGAAFLVIMLAASSTRGQNAPPSLMIGDPIIGAVGIALGMTETAVRQALAGFADRIVQPPTSRPLPPSTTLLANDDGRIVGRIVFDASGRVSRVQARWFRMGGRDIDFADALTEAMMFLDGAEDCDVLSLADPFQTSDGPYVVRITNVECAARGRAVVISAVRGPDRDRAEIERAIFDPRR